MVNVTAKAYGKGLLIAGDTKAVKEQLKSLGGRWNRGCAGWMFPGSKHASVVAELRRLGHDVIDSFTSGGASELAASSKEDSSPPAAKKRKAEAKDNQAKDNQVPVSSFSLSVDIREVKPGKKGIFTDDCLT